MHITNVVTAHFRGFRALLLLLSFLNLAYGQLRSTGVNFDQDAANNGYVVYTSRILLPDKTTTLYPQAEHLLALVNDAYADMIRSCTDNFDDRECPGAMTVFAFEDELHFGSSTKNLQKEKGVSTPHSFYQAFIYEKNSIGFDTSRSGAVARVRKAMIQCQTQRTQSNVDHKQHGRSGRCGEFNAVLTYLLTRDDPENVNFNSNPSRQARIMTVGRRGNNLETPPEFFKPCSKTVDGPSTYGCRQWVQNLGIAAPNPERAIRRPDPGSRVRNIKLCELSIDESRRIAGDTGAGGLDAGGDSSSEFGSGLDDDDVDNMEPIKGGPI
ncbi:hypothetical protein KCU99_g3482, partial [Aureobasidium melanogenum]